MARVSLRVWRWGRGGVLVEPGGDFGLVGLVPGRGFDALRLLWRDQEEKRGSAGWRGRWYNLVHGTAQELRRLGRVWLEANPFVWLAARDWQPAALAWAVVVGEVLLWLVCWAAWPARWLSVPNLFITATLLNSALGWMVCQAAARTLAEPRRDGTYELLLTTPLQASDVVWGQLEALRWQFQPLVRVVLGLEMFMLLAGLVVRKWSGPALAVYSGSSAKLCASRCPIPATRASRNGMCASGFPGVGKWCSTNCMSGLPADRVTERARGHPGSTPPQNLSLDAPIPCLHHPAIMSETRNQFPVTRAASSGWASGRANQLLAGLRLLRTPVARNGRVAMLGYRPETRHECE